MSNFGNHYHPSISASAYSSNHNGDRSMLLVNGILGSASRSRTPVIHSEQSASSQLGNPSESEHGVEEDPRTRLFRSLFEKSEARLNALFDNETAEEVGGADAETGGNPIDIDEKESGPAQGKGNKQPSKKTVRKIDEDDYNDSDEEEDESAFNASPLKSKSTGTATIPPYFSSPAKRPGVPISPALTSTQGPSPQMQPKSSEDIRKRLELEQKAKEEGVKRTFQTQFYLLDSDLGALLEQKKLEEIERQADAESGQNHSATTQPAEGSLSQANLGASSLVLKHLIARIDAKRDAVIASDQELRNLMVEVKKNRSKWASEDKIGQEELYEAAEKVLSEIKAITEHSGPFLQKVNRRDAPDYYTIIKNPMDLSTMTRKLKSLQYKSKSEFVGDLYLIWSNCLKYNASPDHFLRKHALAMRKETEKLVPLIPDIVIRDRAEFEAEERRLHAAEHDNDGDDSDDEPIISSRGRKAPGKKAKKGTNVRKMSVEGTPGAETKPVINVDGLPSSTALRQEFLRDHDAAMEANSTGLNTPPPGSVTPAINGVPGAGASSTADPMDMDGFGASAGGPLDEAQVDYDDPEYKIFKSVTKKDRAAIAAERARLFKDDRVNPEEPALLRSKGGMKRWLRKQESSTDVVLGKRKRDIRDDGEDGPRAQSQQQSGSTLAEGIEGEEERVLPDYYDIMNAIPELNPRLQWREDAEGNIIPNPEETLRIVPKGYFQANDSQFTQKINANLRQMQETRKVCAKIGIVRQMQLQTQMYNNQFQKYEPDQFHDNDIETAVVSDSGPIMDPHLIRATMQRAVAKIFYQSGFEECQPSALEAATEIAQEHFIRLAKTLGTFLGLPKRAVEIPATDTTPERTEWRSKFGTEECVLQTLYQNGQSLNSLDLYVTTEVDRATNKLDTLHTRMKAHLADLLRPALSQDAGEGGVNEFNDNSEQFVGGDFAEDIGEDFFGFKELGLDKEFGMASLSVPLHLLQSRMNNAYSAQNQNQSQNTTSTFTVPPPYEPVTVDNVEKIIGLAQPFFQEKLLANGDSPLVEDEDLPQKQRFPKPRLPPTGKISSPRKKPVREPGPGKGHPKKNMRYLEGEGWVKNSEYEEKKAELKARQDAAASAVANGVNGAMVNGTAKNNQTQAPTQSSTTSAVKQGSKLKSQMSMSEMNGDSDAEGDDDDAVHRIPTLNRKKTVKANGTSQDGGMISPESLEPS